MAYKQIPLSTSPNQTFVCALTINSVSRNIKFFVRFSEVAQYWLMDIGDDDTGANILASIPLVPGNYPGSNLLGQYSYAKIGVVYLINATGIKEGWPSISTLSTDWALVWGDNV